jgi:hypothetical protein
LIAFERKGVTSTSTPVESSTQVVLRNQPTNSQFHTQPKAILSRAWCNFCDDNHEESTCEVKKRAQERIFGKKADTTIVSLDWAPKEDVMMVDTRNKSYENKGKGGNPKTTFSPSSSSQQTNPQVTKGTQSQEVSTSSPSSSKYNILKQLATIKADATLLDMVVFPEQQKHLKEFMEGKTSTIASLSE